MIQAMKDFFKYRENLAALVISAVLVINSLSFLFSNKIFFLFNSPLGNNIYYLVYFFILIVWAKIYLSKEKIDLLDSLKKTLFIFLPTEILFLYAIQSETPADTYIGVVGAAYFFALSLFIVLSGIASDRLKTVKQTVAGRKKSPAVILAIVSIMAISLYFGLFNLGKLAVVDEPLWTFNRIPKFWDNIGEGDWRSARVSDKPGLTVAAISGIGLFSVENPQDYRNIPWVDNRLLTEGEIENFNLAFRLPIWIFVILMLPILYFLLQKLAGRSSALIAIAFIGLSPIIIGNSRIVNPDSILWIFVTSSIITYILYLRNMRRSTLFLAALFLTLGILTKYTANILYLFFLVLIFAEYIFNHEKYSKENFYPYLKKRLTDYLLLVALSFSLFYVLYPAVWDKPDRVLIGTIYSQALEPIWPLFASILGFILADLIILKSLIMKKIIAFFVRFRRILFLSITSAFLLSIIVTILNTYLDMRFFNFEEILASPKSSFRKTSVLGFFLSNFYPLVFGISIIALSGLVAFLTLSLKKKSQLSRQKILVVFYLLLFVLAYYLGSVASHVASIIRYQIVIFPIIFIAAGIACSELFRVFILNDNESRKKTFLKQSLFFTGAIIILALSLWQAKPFYMGYVSALLPERYYLDIKDMGEGSYEAAAYLNSLPDADKIGIWTDKKGVCTFFTGKCYTNLSQSFFDSHQIDHIVVSSGRASRTTNMGNTININGLSFSEIYNNEEYLHIIEIGGRSNNFVKIIDANKSKD